MALTSDEGNYFRTRERQVKDTYNIGQAQNTYQQQTGKQQFGRATTDLARKFDQMREQMPWGHARRGTLNSGIWGGDLQRYATDRSTATTNLNAGYQEQLGALQLAQQQLAAIKGGGLLDMEDAKEARLRTVAEMISGAQR